MDCYMILGNKSPNGIPSKDMISRVSYANLLLADKESVDLVLSGIYEEVHLMRSLVSDKVSSIHNIALDIDSTNTIKSIQYLNGIKADKKIIITSDYHIPRVKVMTSRIGCDCEVIGSPTESKIFLKVFVECLLYVFALLSPVSLSVKFSKVSDK